MKSLRSYKGRKVLITGGAGFIGLNLVKAFKEAGARLTITSLKSDLPGFSSRDLLKTVAIKTIDIRDRAAMARIVKGKDFIFHLAGRSGAVNSLSDPISDLEVNCQGGLILLESCRKFNPEAIVLGLGSRLQFGKPSYLPVDEEHPLRPNSIHGINKLVLEKYFMLYHQIYKLKTIYLRVTNPYGPYQSPGLKNFGIVNFFIQQAMQNKTIKVFGPGKQLRDYIYIDDLIEVMMLAPLKAKAYGQVFNIGSGRGITLSDMVKTIIRLAGGGCISHAAWPAPYKSVETGDFVADINKAKKILGWEPGTSILQGLQKSLAFYRDFDYHSLA